MEIFVATGDGFRRLRREGAAWHEIGGGLRGHNVTSIIAREGVILAGTDAGVYRSRNLGLDWEFASEDLATRHVRWLAFHPDISDREFAGMEPAGIFMSNDGGDSWYEAPEVNRLREQFDWFLPYSPEAGCVRGFAFSGERAYAAVEVGAALRSDDGGMTWRLAGGSDGIARFGRPVEDHTHPDVHSIVVFPGNPDFVIAPTGGGLYRSDDGGETWECLYECYCRALWLDPDNPDHMVFGPADSVSRNGRLEESFDGGRRWQSISDAAGAPWARHMPERLAQVKDQLFAVLSNGELIVATIGEWAWQPVLGAAKKVQAVTHMM